MIVMKKFLFIPVLLMLALVSCKKEAKGTLSVSFTLDKDSYGINEPVVITNTSTVENDVVSSWYWEWNGQHKYGKTMEVISFPEAGDYPVSLSATTEGGLKGNCSVTVHVVDNNVPPVADFSWSPTQVRVGEVISFTDASTDSDGTITAWEWSFGAEKKTEQNPKYTFSQAGENTVSLTVTDNKYGKNTKTVTINVLPGSQSMSLKWKYAYDTNPNAHVVWTSPAVSPDGKQIYAISSGYKLAAVNKAGEHLWTFDAGQFGANANENVSQTGSWATMTPTPSVDENGFIYVAVGFRPSNDANQDTSTPSGIFCVNSQGAQRWYLEATWSRFRSVCPVIAGNYIGLQADKSNKFGGNMFFINRNTGVVSSASAAMQRTVVAQHMGSVIAWKNADGKYVFAGEQAYYNGVRIYWPDVSVEGKWTYSEDGAYNYNLGWYTNDSGVRTTNNECLFSGQMATDAAGRLYILSYNYTGQEAGAGFIKTSDYAAILYCYDTKSLARNTSTAPLWKTGLHGSTWPGGANTRVPKATGSAMSPDGTTLYVATCSITHDYAGTQTAHITAVNASTGAVIWEHEILGNTSGVPAVDSNGYIYYCDYTMQSLVKLNPADGSKLASITLGTSIQSSPVIGPDGTIYVNGEDTGGATLFAVEGASAPGAGWSQLGGNYRHTGTLLE